MRERSSNWLPPLRAWPGDQIRQTRDQTCNLDICPHWELNPQPFSYGKTLQPTEPQRPGQYRHIFKFKMKSQCWHTIHSTLFLGVLHYEDVPQLNHSSVDRHMNCFKFSVNTSKAPMNTYIKVFVWTYAFISHRCSFEIYILFKVQLFS